MVFAYTPLSPQTAHILHFIFEWLALLVGVQSYRLLKKHQVNKSQVKQQVLPASHHTPTTQSAIIQKNNTQQANVQQASLLSKSNFAVALGCILGAAVGNKLLFLIEVPQAWAQFGWLSLALGQTIVGGMMGGLIGIEIAKKLAGIKHSTGDLFIIPFCLGLIVGRIGCFLAGLNDGTFGVATGLPWGIDFGDGILRHPTQIYDMLWAVTMLLFFYMTYPKLKPVSGLSFKLLFVSYMLWRLFIDGFKPVPYAYWLGLSGIQWGCILALIIYSPWVIRDIRKLYAYYHHPLIA